MKYLKYIFILFISSTVFSQVDNSSLFFEHEFDSTKDEVAFVKIQGLGYMKDIENFGPMVDGYTLFGAQFNPQVGYQFSKNFSVEGGVFLRKDFGHKDINDVFPTFSLRYQKKDFKMIFGNINGSVRHKLIEPMYAFERVITNRVESGAQFMLNKKKFDFDVWIDWQNMIYRLDDKYERFWLGASVNTFKYENNKFQFKVPLQGTLRHNGGQIARGGLIGKETESVYTNMNYCGGLYFKYKINNKNFKSIYFDARYVANKNNNKKDTLIYKHFGDGMLANIGVNVFNTDIMLSYWYGGDYSSEFGGALYQNLSSSLTYAGTYVSYRNLLILRITKVIPLAKKAILTLRMEPQYDLNFKRVSYDIGFYLSFDKQVFLK